MMATYDALLKAQQADMAERDKLRDRMRERKAQMDALIHADEAERLLKGMSPGQIDAIANAARAESRARVADATAEG
jgi:hypothetical protein